MKQSADRLGWRKVHPERFAISAFTISALIAASAANAANSNPYNGITDRNVFSLKPKVEAPAALKEEPKPPVKLTLTGITTLFGNKRALLAAQIPAKPPEQAKNESYMLTEGQRDGGVEVVSIDEKAGKVVVNNNGIRETLDFVNNGAKLMASATAGPTTPGFIGQAPPSGAAPHGIPAPVRSIPTRSPGGPSVSNNSPTGPGTATAGANIPNQFQNNITPEEQTVMIEGQRILLQEQGKHEEAALFPITDITPGQPGSDSPSPF